MFSNHSVIKCRTEIMRKYTDIGRRYIRIRIPCCLILVLDHLSTGSMTQPDMKNSVKMKCTCYSFESCKQIKVKEPRIS